MLIFKGTQGNFCYATTQSAAADLCSQVTVTVYPGQTVKIPTGLWIDPDYTTLAGATSIPYLEVAPRSGVSLKTKLRVANAPGIVDIDYQDEICVIIDNIGTEAEQINAGDRVAQISLKYSYRLPNVVVKDKKRKGGFGSTGR